MMSKKRGKVSVGFQRPVKLLILPQNRGGLKKFVPFVLSQGVLVDVRQTLSLSNSFILGLSNSFIFLGLLQLLSNPNLLIFGTLPFIYQVGNF